MSPGGKLLYKGANPGRKHSAAGEKLSIEILANLMSTLKTDLCGMQPLPLIAPNKYPG